MDGTTAGRHAIPKLWRAARDGLGRLGRLLADADDSSAETVFQTRPREPGGDHRAGRLAGQPRKGS